MSKGLFSVSILTKLTNSLFIITTKYNNNNKSQHINLGLKKNYEIG